VRGRIAFRRVRITEAGVWRRDCEATKAFSGWKRGRVVARKIRAESVRSDRARVVGFEAA
jgi:hypothetical protein